MNYAHYTLPTETSLPQRSYHRKFHSRRRKKRPKIFYGKRYQESETEAHGSTSEVTTVSKLKLALPQPTIEAEVHSDSSSSSSNTNSGSDSCNEEETSDGSDEEMQIGYESSGNRVLDVAALNSALTKAANCSVCGNTGTLQVRSDFTTRSGIVVPTSFHCTNCGNTVHIESKKIDSPGRRCAYELNSRLALGMRLMGRGRAALRKLCGVMELPPPLSSKAFQAHTKAIHEAVVAEAHASICQAVQNIRDRNSTPHDHTMDISVSCDAAWAPLTQDKY